ncbi:MAG TPA: chemotaxis protein CheW [Vicinamibacterales bacterium]|nr:chemotaxis protein CheW [Vicinamibacterales bacterium]
MSDNTDNYILFAVAGTTYALPSNQVAHVEMVEEITRVPNAASFVDGVVFSRGQVVPAVNLRVRFGFERAPRDLRTRLLVVQLGGRSVGLLVDACREFLTIPATGIQPPGEGLAGAGARYMSGIATLNDRLVVILNLGALLDSAEPILAA